MAYENPGIGAANKGSKNTFFLSPDMLPEGVADGLKEGDYISLCVVAPRDQDGEIEVEYDGKSSEPAHEEAAEGEGTEGRAGMMAEGGAGEMMAGEGGASWEDDLRREFSPRTPEESA